MILKFNLIMNLWYISVRSPVETFDITVFRPNFDLFGSSFSTFAKHPHTFRYLYECLLPKCIWPFSIYYMWYVMPLPTFSEITQDHVCLYSSVLEFRTFVPQWILLNKEKFLRGIMLILTHLISFKLPHTHSIMLWNVDSKLQHFMC